MMNLRVLRRLNDDLGAKAARRGLKPFVPSPGGKLYFPNLGSHEPAGWERLEQNWFVAKTAENKLLESYWDTGPAIQQDKLFREVRAFMSDHSDETIGFAIVEEGEFQVVIDAFRKES